MLRCIHWRLAGSILLAATLFPAAALTQSQEATSKSLAEAARRARDQKKKSEKPVRVLTDAAPNLAVDSPEAQAIPPAPVTAPPESTAPDTDTATAAPGDATAALPTDEAVTKISAEVDALQQEIAEKQIALDFAQRDLALQQDTYYSNPEYPNDAAGKSKTAGMQQQVTLTQQELDELKTRLAAANEAKLHAPKPAPPAPAPPPPAEPALPPAPKPPPPPPLPPGES